MQYNSEQTKIDIDAIEEFNVAINFALDQAGEDGLIFLAYWREGAWDILDKNWPEFKNIRKIY